MSLRTSRMSLRSPFTTLVLASVMLVAACRRAEPQASGPVIPDAGVLQVAHQQPAQPAPPKAAEPPAGEDPAAVAAGRVARGGELYKQMCAVCHGDKGEGYRADQAPALQQPDFLAAVSDTYLGLAIAEGRKGTTMSAWLNDRGGPLSYQDIQALIALFRSWQKQPNAKLDERAVTGDAERGKALFTQHCERCHGDKGPYVRILQRQLLSTATNGFLRHALHVGRPPTPMPSFTAELGEPGIEDVLAYIRTFPAFREPPPPPRPPPPLPLGRVPLNPRGPDPKGFEAYPKTTSVDVVHDALKHKARVALLDARAPTDYTEQHIKGAVSVPFYDPSPYLDRLPKDTWLVAYCACPHAESKTLAAKLVEAGFRKVTVLEEGLGVWAGRGYPVQRGTEQ